MNSTPSGAELLLLPRFSEVGSNSTTRTVVASTRTLSDRPSDALAFFELDEASGNVELRQFGISRKGRQFRGVGVSKDGKWVVATGQVSAKNR